jgi:hypothetical protein
MGAVVTPIDPYNASDAELDDRAARPPLRKPRFKLTAF